MSVNEDDIDAGQVWWLVPADDAAAVAVAATIVAVHRDEVGHVYAVDVRRESDGLHGAMWRRRRGNRWDPTTRTETVGSVDDVWAGFMRPRDESWFHVDGSVEPYSVLLRPDRH